MAIAGSCDHLNTISQLLLCSVGMHKMQKKIRT